MPATLTRDRRIEARADGPTMEVILEAARLTNSSVSTFVADAAREKAERLVALTDRTFMPAEMFDEMIVALDYPQPAPELVELFSRPKRITRKWQLISRLETS